MKDVRDEVVRPQLSSQLPLCVSALHLEGLLLHAFDVPSLAYDDDAGIVRDEVLEPQVAADLLGEDLTPPLVCESVGHLHGLCLDHFEHHLPALEERPQLAHLTQILFVAGTHAQSKPYLLGNQSKTWQLR